MKKFLLILLFFTILIGCSSTKTKSYPEFVIGLKEKNTRKSVDIDSLNIITPHIEIYNITSIENSKSYVQSDKRELIRSFVLKTLKSELVHAEYFEIPLMYKDYLSVNKVLERIQYEKSSNPKWIIKAPEQLLVPKKKYTVLITYSGKYGKVNGGVMYLSLINNFTKVIEFTDRYDFSNSPLNNMETEKLINQALLKIINT